MTVYIFALTPAQLFAGKNADKKILDVEENAFIDEERGYCPANWPEGRAMMSEQNVK